MNKAVIKAFKEWRDRALKPGGAIASIEHAQGLPAYLEESNRRAFAAGANWQRQR